VEIPEDKINTFYELCRCFRLHITESNPYENAQVAAGGIAVTEVTEDMESKLCPGLYFAGEILDVDGRCGGYNLQVGLERVGFIGGVFCCNQDRIRSYMIRLNQLKLR